MTNMKKRIAATLTAAILATALTVPAAAEVPSIRVSSYKGSTLGLGEHRHLQRPRNGSGRAGADLLGCRRQSGGECGDHRLQQRRGVWTYDADGQFHYSHHSRNTIRWRQYQPDRQLGDTPGDDPPD